MGESRLDRNVKRFFVQLHRAEDPSHTLASVVLMARTGTTRGGGRGTRKSAATPPAAVEEGDTHAHRGAAARALLLDAAHALARGATRESVPADQGRRRAVPFARPGSRRRRQRVRARAGDVLSPLIRNLGSMLVKGATPVEILKQYMAKGDSPTRGRELNIHFGDTERGFIGQISPLGDMVPVMAGVTLTLQDAERATRRTRLRRRRRDVDGRVPRRDQLRRRAALSARRRRREQRLRVLDADWQADARARSSSTRRLATASPPSRRTATTSSRRTRRRSARSIVRAAARASRSSSSSRTAERVTPSTTTSRTCHRARSSSGSATTIRSRATSRGCATSGVSGETLAEIDARVTREIDEATDVAEQSGVPEALDALVGVYADPPAERPLWFREGKAAVVDVARAPRGLGHVRRAREGCRLMAEITYLEAIREALFEEMERDAERLLPRRGHRRVRRRVQGHRRVARRSSGSRA